MPWALSSMTSSLCWSAMSRMARHVGALAVEVDGDDGLGLLGDGLLDLLGIDVLGLGVAIDEHSCGAGDPDGFGGGEEGVGGA